MSNSATTTASTTLSGVVEAATPGVRGFDTTLVVTPPLAQAFVEAGYKFAVRYVHRVATGEDSATLTTQEARTILGAGLALMVVQYYAGEGWQPSASLGATYGANAARFAAQIGVPRGVTLWCDLESPSGSEGDVIAYCNAWYDQVQAAGYTPGLYVGVPPGITSQALYYALKFENYWCSYNLNLDQYPAVRGVQMRQQSSQYDIGQHGTPNYMQASDYDVDVTQTDALGGNAMWLAPPGSIY